MTADTLFPILNLVAMAGWLVLALWPRRQEVHELVAGAIVPALLAGVYVAIVAAHWGGAEGGFSTLSDVATLFTNRWLLLAGWTHYLAFDLLVGAWEMRDARPRGVPHLLLLPCLMLTFLFGPAGWLSYLVVRTVVARSRARPALTV
jgi:hypothetical protein